MATQRFFDMVGFVETAYGLDLAEPQWLDELVRAAAPGMDQGLGVAAVSWALAPGRIDVRTVRGAMEPELLALVPRTYDGLPRALIARYFAGPASVLRLSDDPRAIDFALRRVASSSRLIRDVVGAQVGDGRGSGLTLGAFAPRRARFGSARQRSFVRLLSHVGAALRLRAKLRARLLERAAIVDPDGRVNAAEGELRSGAPREALVHAVRAIELARGRLRRTSPEEALTAWRALVDGKWSVVDWVDVDGRRFLVAYENRLAPRDPRALSPREREVAEYLVYGRSSSEIAYALGLGVGTVEALARSVLRKLGCARRTDLAATFGAPPGLGWLDDDLVALGAEQRESGQWDRLGSAVRDVVALAIDGASNDDIARARGCSAHTVANQLATAYGLFGVRGRTELAALLGTRSVRPAK